MFVLSTGLHLLTGSIMFVCAVFILYCGPILSSADYCLLSSSSLLRYCCELHIINNGVT